MKGWITGWRRISSYIGRSVKTTKKYYKKYSMPVLKDPSGRPFIIPDVIDRWIIEYNRLKKSETNKKT